MCVNRRRCCRVIARADINMTWLRLDAGIGRWLNNEPIGSIMHLANLQKSLDDRRIPAKDTTIAYTTAIVVITTSPSLVRRHRAFPSRSRPCGPGNLVLLVRSVQNAIQISHLFFFHVSSEPYDSTTLSTYVFRISVALNSLVYTERLIRD